MHIHMNDWITLLYAQNSHNNVSQLYFNKKIKLNFKKTPESSFAPSTMWRYGKVGHLHPGGGLRSESDHAGILALNTPPELWWSFLLCISHPVSGALSQLSEQAKAPPAQVRLGHYPSSSLLPLPLTYCPLYPEIPSKPHPPHSSVSTNSSSSSRGSLSVTSQESSVSWCCVPGTKMNVSVLSCSVVSDSLWPHGL